jgi:hypothetical protein
MECGTHSVVNIYQHSEEAATSFIRILKMDGASSSEIWVSTRLHSVTSEKIGVFTRRISYVDTDAGVYLQFENLEFIVVHRVS